MKIAHPFNLLILAGAIRFLPPAHAQDANHTIIPGTSLGRISLGMTASQVHKLLGKPSQTRKRAGGLSVDIYLSKKTRETPVATVRDHLDVLYRHGHVVQIEATSPKFQIRGGLSTLSTARQVRFAPYHWQLLAFDYYESQHETSWVNYYFSDIERGFTVEFEGEEARLPADLQPTTLIVHKKGSRVIPDAGGTKSRNPMTLGRIIEN